MQWKRARSATLSIFLTAVFAVLVFTMPTKALAASNLSETEVQSLARYFSQFVQTVKKPFYVYNWFNANGHPEFLQRENADSPRALLDVRKMAARHWAAGYFDGKSYMSAGLYAALDPGVSLNYGGQFGNDWILTQIHFPVGTRVINIANVGYEKNIILPPQILSLLHKSECAYGLQTADAKDALYLLLGAKGQKTPTSEKCFALAKNIFDERLKIDAFAYSWHRAPVLSEDCPNLRYDSDIGDMGSIRKSANGEKPGAGTPDIVAFVITRSDRLSKDDVLLFNAQSTDAREQRIKIQGFISRSNEAHRTGMIQMTLPLLWKDLEVPDTAGTVDWMRENIYGCDASVDFGL